MYQEIQLFINFFTFASLVFSLDYLTDLIVLMISSVSSFKFVNVVVPEPFFYGFQGLLQLLVIYIYIYIYIYIFMEQRQNLLPNFVC